jgi:L-ascorbate metabolism protein UlaG (beta-lactamase superfamily)
MRIRLVRHATLIVELGGRRILVDPMLDDMGARPAVDNTPNPAPNPTARLPFPADRAVEGLDAVLVTHRHQDHLDARAIQLMPRRLPVFCQPEDESALRALGLGARPVGDRLDWDGFAIERVPARHGHGAVADALAPVSGFVLAGELYIAGDTVWYEEVERTIARLHPRVVVVNSGGARFLDSDLITMGTDDVREVAARVPAVVAVHLEAVNHCLLTRAELRAALPDVRVPEDGETLDL